MATKMVMPLLGQTMEEGTIIKWFKNEGDQIKEGEPLLEVLTDKVNMEVESPEAGVLRKILAPVDAIVPVKDPICIIAKADESIDALLADEPSAPAEQPAAVGSAQNTASEESSRSPHASAGAKVETPAQPQAAVAAEGRIFTSPAARRVAKERGIDISQLAGTGTGPNGRIVENDVLTYAESLPRATPLAGKMATEAGIALSGVAGTGERGKITSADIVAAQAQPAAASALTIGSVIPFAGLRKSVAQNVAASAQTAPHVTLVSEVDMSACVAMRNKVLPDIEKRMGIRISYTDIIIKAAAAAILAKPIVNSSIQGDNIVVHNQVNIGVATAIEGGLVVPVVKDAVGKTIPQISAEVKELVAKARSGQAKGSDMAGGTFTITNLGGYGIDVFNPIITPGQSAILGVCRIVEKPVAVSGEVLVRPMMNLCLSFDHRVMDGAPAAEYLARLKEILENPYLIFM